MPRIGASPFGDPRTRRAPASVARAPGHEERVTVATQPAVAMGTGPTGATSVTPAVRLEGVRKIYGDVVAVAGIDLDIATGEFFSMLGPSGSGKTTTLRMIAGFELPTDG